MRRHLVNGLLLPSLLALGLAACGGGSSAESLANEQMSVMSDFTATLTKITDKASAEDHKGDLEAAIAKMNELKAKLEPKMAELMQTMMNEMMRVGANPDLGPIVMPVLEKMQD